MTERRILRITDTEHGPVIDLPTPRLMEFDVLLGIVNEHIYGEEEKTLKLKDPVRGWRRARTVNTKRLLKDYPNMASKIVAFMIFSSPGARIRPRRLY